jgi:hypothetical protein
MLDGREIEHQFLERTFSFNSQVQNLMGIESSEPQIEHKIFLAQCFAQL